MPTAIRLASTDAKNVLAPCLHNVERRGLLFVFVEDPVPEQLLERYHRPAVMHVHVEAAHPISERVLSAAMMDVGTDGIAFQVLLQDAVFMYMKGCEVAWDIIVDQVLGRRHPSTPRRCPLSRFVIAV